MTAYEIWEQINYFVIDPDTDEAVCNTLQELYYDNKDSEAIEYIKNFFKCDNNTAKDVFSIFKEETGEPPSQAQIAHNNAVARELLNTPKCPTCNSTNIKKISALSKVTGASMFGLFSKTARSQFQCNNCGYKW